MRYLLTHSIFFRFLFCFTRYFNVLTVASFSGDDAPAQCWERWPDRQTSTGVGGGRGSRHTGHHVTHHPASQATNRPNSHIRIIGIVQ